MALKILNSVFQNKLFKELTQVFKKKVSKFKVNEPLGLIKYKLSLFPQKFENRTSINQGLESMADLLRGNY